MNYMKLILTSEEKEIGLNGLHSEIITRESNKFDYKPGDLDSMRSAIDKATEVIAIETECGLGRFGVRIEFGRADGTIIDIIDGCDIQDAKTIINAMCIV